MPVEHPQYTLQYDLTQDYAYEGRTKTKFFPDLARLRAEADRVKRDDTITNVRAFIVWTTVRKEDIDL